MGFWDTITDLVDAATPWSTVEAEAPTSGAAGAGPAKESASEVATETVDDSKVKESSDDSSEDKEEESTEDEPEEEEDEEEEEEELKDPKETFEEECRNSKQCAPAKHHFEECVERVENGSKEDCVEEFFHLTHCATQCAAPKLWATLK